MNLITFLYSFLLVVLYLKGTPGSANSRKCVTLYSESGFNHVKGLNFSLSEGSQYGNLREEYFVDSMNPWNTTGSFVIENGCRLTACAQSYFQGQCQEFDESVNNVQSLGFETFLSLNCSCEKECACSDIRLRKSACAYAFDGNGCETCNPLYFEIKGSKPNFQTAFSVGAIKVRDSCALTIHDEEDFEGQATVFQSGTLVQNFTSSIKSYECSCSEIPQVVEEVPRNASNPPLINIPKDIDGISSLINGDYQHHPGLQAALKSVLHKRSSRNAYVFVLGSTGSGKSTAINVLFDNPNVTQTGVGSSVTSVIHEFRIRVPVDDLGIANSGLHIIDTPGLGDTRGIEQDAKFLATLDDFLSNHEELQDKIPNVVLIFHRFSDNRFSGKGSGFVKMLRGLESLRGRLIDEDYSNVIFVLSHFCSMNKNITKNPSERLLQFKNVIEEFTTFPKPISVVVAEHKAAEYDLAMINGNFKLPNGELYPQNILSKINLLTLRGQDPIGQSVIQTAFNDYVYHNDYNISVTSHKLIPNNNTKLPLYLNLLIGLEIEEDKTEVSQLLAAAYNSSMDENLKATDPGCLQYLQKALNMQNIRNKSDIPTTTVPILKLLSSIKKTEATLYLLDKALSVKPPVFPQSFVTGEFEGTPQFQSPFKQATNPLKVSDIGYAFPSFVTFKEVNEVKDNFKTFKTPQEYLEYRRESVGMKVTDPVYPAMPSFSQGGFNILSPVNLTPHIKLSALREYRTFKLVLNHDLELSTDFTNVLRALPPFNENNVENVRMWRNFFVKYGAFVVHAVYGGGAIEIEAHANNASMVTTISKSIFDLIDFADKVELNGRSRLDLSGVEYSLSFKGGDPAFHRRNFRNMNIEEVSSLLSNWRKSLPLRPVFLTTDLKLVPLSELAKTVGQNISSEVHDCTLRLINSNLRYNPSKRVVVDLDSCKKHLVESAKTASNQTAMMVDEIKKMNEKIKEFQAKIKVDKEKAEKSIRDLDSEKSRLASQVAEKASEVRHREQCEAHKMTSHKY